ncbi:hypothetical protein M0802_016428 [Mischocyttarus mexicanus]|nr:hypothetical protein M0802_016428 [Mischocyttarus mexicanus]
MASNPIWPLKAKITGEEDRPLREATSLAACLLANVTSGGHGEAWSPAFVQILLDPNVDHLVRVKALKTLTRHSAEALLMFSASTERVQVLL